MTSLCKHKCTVYTLDTRTLQNDLVRSCMLTLYRCRRHTSRTAGRCYTTWHRLCFRNIHRWSVCSWSRNCQPRRRNIGRSGAVRWQVEDRNELVDYLATPRAVGPTRSSTVRRGSRTLLYIPPKTDWRNTHRNQRRHSLAAVLFCLCWKQINYLWIVLHTDAMISTL